MCIGGWQIRYTVTLLSFLGFVNIFSMRVNLSVALVAMVNHTAESKDTSSIDQQLECPTTTQSSNTTIHQKQGDFYWDLPAQSVILGSFYYGYILTQIPGGYLAERFGAKWLFGGGVFVTALLTLLTPWAANQGFVTFVLLRVGEGLGEGVTFPAMNALIGHWSPVLERSRMTAFVFAGATVGSVFSMPISGFLCDSDILGGWPTVFYLFGTLGIVWFIIWILVIYEDPASHPKLTPNELFLIQDGRQISSKENSGVPWKSLLTSIPVWALVVTNLGCGWGFIVLLNELPTYLSLLNFDLKTNGLLSALPHLLQCVSICIFSFLADKLREMNFVSISAIRKSFNTVGFVGAASCLIGVTFCGCESTIIIILISLCFVFKAISSNGFNVTPTDMDPDLAGTLNGLTNTAYNLSGVLGTFAVGQFTAHGNTLRNWNSIFYISSALYIMSALVFNLFGSAEPQQWSTQSSCKKKAGLPESTCKISMKNIDNVN